MNLREILVPAVLTEVRTIDPGEIRRVTLVLPEAFEVDGTVYQVRDTMRPGNAFLTRPMGARTQKLRRRMYTRSNCALTAERVLETFINHTHEAKADTSIWWQTEAVETLHRAGGTVDVRVDFTPDKSALVLYENSAECRPTNLRLEPDDCWPGMQVLAIALSTGITPFLAHLRYLQASGFGRARQPPGCRFTLIASVRHPRQLMDHDELLDLQRQFPSNFRYYPVLTREWPSEWPYGKGRILRSTAGADGDEQVDLDPLLAIVPDIARHHVRFCGNAAARDQLARGLRQKGHQVRSFRSEVW